MARHYVYAKMTPISKGIEGRTVAIGSVRKIDTILVDINADRDNEKDIQGEIIIKRAEDGEIVVEVDCPHYVIDIKSGAIVLNK